MNPVRNYQIKYSYKNFKLCNNQQKISNGVKKLQPPHHPPVSAGNGPLGFTPHHHLKNTPIVSKLSAKHGAGFTLIEILIYISVLAIIILAVISFFIWANRSNAKIKASREVIDNSRRAMEIITSEIKEARNIYNPTSILDSNPGQLSLITSKYLPDDETSTYIDFYLCGSRICLKKESQDPVVLTSNNVEVKNLIFKKIATDLNNPSIQIDLKIDYKTQSTRPEYQATVTLTDTASLRSY